MHHEVQPCDEGAHRAALDHLLAPWLKPKKQHDRGPATRAKGAGGPWVQIALPESRVFHAVVPITGANRSATPQAYFMEATQATNMRAEERVIDLLKLELNKKPLAALAASQRLLITDIIDALSGLGAARH